MGNRLKSLGSWAIVFALVVASPVALPSAVAAIDADSSITGKVTDADTTLPVEGAEVDVLYRNPSGPAELVAEVITDASGDFTVPIAAGTYDLVVNKSGYAERQIKDVAAPSGSSVVQNLELEPLILAAYGFVLDEDGAPLEGATVRALWQDEYGEPAEVSVVTGSGGAYEIHLADSVGGVDLIASMPGYDPQWVWFNFEGTVNQQQFNLAIASLAVSGAVVEDGTLVALEGARVDYAYTYHGARYPGAVLTNASGQYEIYGPPISYDLTVTMAGYSQVATSGVEYDGTTPAIRDFSLEPSTTPTALADSYDTAEDTTLTVPAPGVLSNDTDADGDTLSAVKESDPSHGSLALAADGSLTYSPDANWFGEDTFTYRANDGTSDSEVATVTISVSAVNDAPVAADDAANCNMNQSVSISKVVLLGNDSDVEDDPLTLTEVSQPTNGSVSIVGDNVIYTPNTDYVGEDEFTYTVSDGQLTGTATVVVTVLFVNRAPVAVADAYETAEDTTLTVAAPGLLSNDTDEDVSDTLSSVKESDPSHGTLALSSDGSFTYTPDEDWFGEDAFTYRANDGTDDSEVVTATIAVNPVNDAPVAADDAATVAEDGSLLITLAATDIDSASLTYSVASQPAHGTLSPVVGDTVTYTPDANWFGEDAFAFRANDGALDSEPATVTITVNAVNDAPVAADDAATVAEDGSLPITLAATDIDSASLTYSVASQPAHGTLSPVVGDTLTYTPDANWFGTDSFTFVANDGADDSEPANVTITVNSVNDAPVAIADTLSTNENTARFVPAPGVLVDDTDIDGDTLAAVRVAGPFHGTLIFNPNGSFTYAPVKGWSGTDSFTYKAYDGKAYSAAVPVTITVRDTVSTTSLTLGAPSVSSYASAKVYGYLKDASGRALSGKPVAIQYYSGGWKTAATVYTNSTGYFYRTMKPTTKTSYRAVFAGEAAYYGFTSVSRTVLPKVYLTRPSFGRSTLAYGKTYKARGYLKPRHKAYTYPVKIAVYRYSSGKYRYYKTYKAKAYNYSSYTKYVRSIKLPKKGKWRLRVVHAADSKNAKTYSSWRYVTVK